MNKYWNARECNFSEEKYDGTWKNENQLQITNVREILRGIAFAVFEKSFFKCSNEPTFRLILTIWKKWQSPNK